MSVSKNFPVLLMSLLQALIAKNSHILGGIYLLSLKKSPNPNLKGFGSQ